MSSLASVHLPPEASSAYVRIDVAGEPVGYLRANVYDRIVRDEAEFATAMEQEGAEEEAHSKPGRRVVRLRGEAALTTLYDHLALRE